MKQTAIDLKLDEKIEDAEYEIRYTEKHLIECAESLAQDMTKLAARLSTKLENMTASVNPLGEIQAAGSRIDVLCSRLAENRKTLKILKQLKSFL
jgi:hypothetical protein